VKFTHVCWWFGNLSGTGTMRGSPPSSFAQRTPMYVASLKHRHRVCDKNTGTCGATAGYLSRQAGIKKQHSFLKKSRDRRKRIRSCHVMKFHQCFDNVDWVGKGIWWMKIMKKKKAEVKSAVVKMEVSGSMLQYSNFSSVNLQKQQMYSIIIRIFCSVFVLSNNLPGYCLKSSARIKQRMTTWAKK